jgi:lipopolysaccharide export system permease protein
MKKIHLLILKSFIAPFLATFFVVMFVLLLLFLFKYIDDMIGKGFAWYIILELMMYSSATNVQMALPLSVLLSVIMTYGSLGENYELVAIKAAGISLTRAMFPMIIIISILSVIAFIFSDYMLPVANLKYYSLLYDVRQQRSATLLPEGVFSPSFPGYTIRVDKKDPDGQTLHGIIIYQKDPNTSNFSDIFAKEGRMYRTPGDKFLVLKLKDGIRYEESKGDAGYNVRQRLIRFRFNDMEEKLDLAAFKLSRTPEDEFKTEYQMMDINQLRFAKKKMLHQIDSVNKVSFQSLAANMKYFMVPKKSKKISYITVIKKDTGAQILNNQVMAVAQASNEVREVQNLIANNIQRNKDNTQNIRRSLVEYYKKYTLSAVCLVLFLIGAPLGAIIRRGGLGLPVVISVAFFLIYYIISTIGEKSVKDGNTPPILGMWIAIILLTPIGIFLSYKAATDSAIFDADSYKRVINKLFRRKKTA